MSNLTDSRIDEEPQDIVTEAEPVADEVLINLDPPETSPTSAEVFTISRDFINYVVVAVVFLGVGVLLGMNLAGSGTDMVRLRAMMNEVVQETVHNEVAPLRELLLNVASGGEIDMDALRLLVQDAVSEAGARRVNTLAERGAYLGPEDAPVVIVEFSDFLCPYCGQHYRTTLDPLLENYDGYIRYVYRHFPGVGGQNAVASALAVECANDQGQFWEYHNLLFSDPSALSTTNPDVLENVLLTYAGRLELNMEQFTSCLRNRNHMARVLRDASDAQLNGARGTPSFFINGTFLSGAQPYEIFADFIEAELAEAGIEFQPAEDRG